MTCDYKFPTEDGNVGLSIGGNIWGTTYLNNVEGWPGTNPSTNTTATDWTQWDLTENKRLLDQTKFIGIAHGQGAGDKVICIDNIVVWEFNDAAGVTHNSSAPATVTFANSTGAAGDITMPSAFSGIAWCNLYGAQGSGCTINLNNYAPTGAPDEHPFLGWSLTDGGNVIKQTMYSEFKIPGSITLYAVWDGLEGGNTGGGGEEGVTANLVCVENFESCEVGPYVGNIIDLGTTGLGSIESGCTLEICEEEDGNKYLKATVPDKCAFGYYFGTGNDRKYAYMAFGYKFENAQGNGHFASYANDGSSSWLNGINTWNIDKGDASTNNLQNSASKWTRAIGNNYAKEISACMGIAHRYQEGTCVIYIDDIDRKSVV